MINTPHIAQRTPQLVARIRLTIPRNEIHTVMGPGLGEIMTAVKSQGIGIAGPWFTHHLKMSPVKMDPGIFDFEICVPVTAPVAAVGRVTPGETVATRVARTVYHGPYEGLGAAWGEFCAWISANGHEPCADLYECYLAGPESSLNPEDWRTELSQPLK